MEARNPRSLSSQDACWRPQRKNGPVQSVNSAEVEKSGTVVPGWVRMERCERGKGAVSCSLTTLKTQLALVVTAIGNSAYRSPGWENTTCAYSTQSLFRDYRERAFPLAFDSSCPPTYTCTGIGLTQSPQCHSQAAPISYRHVPKLLGFCFFLFSGLGIAFLRSTIQLHPPQLPEVWFLFYLFVYRWDLM